MSPAKVILQENENDIHFYEKNHYFSNDIFNIMKQGSLIQQALFQQIKDRLPAELSFVHDISEILHISYDSAYRRIRGEKELSLEELKTLSHHYGISIDTLFRVESSQIIFKAIAVEEDGLSFKEWLTIVHDDVKSIHDSSEKLVIYAAKDVPLFHYFQFPEIAAFKIFLWHKTLFDFHSYKDRLFLLDDADEELFKIGEEMLITSTKIPTIELWNEETFISILRQVEYYWESGFFAKRDDALAVIEKFKIWLSHIQSQAEYGFKYIYGRDPVGVEGYYKLYLNEVLLYDNTILVKMGDLRMTYLTYNILNLLVTSNPIFFHQVEETLHSQMKKALLISGTAARERNRFFLKLRNKVEQLQERIRR
jgi:hypothetical protein